MCEHSYLEHETVDVHCLFIGEGTISFTGGIPLVSRLEHEPDRQAIELSEATW